VIPIKTKEEIEIMREGGKLLAGIMKQISESAKPGIKTKELDKLARELIESVGAKPAFLNYGGFPASLCVSINEEVVHGVPSERELKQGDVLSLDLGLIYKGFVADMAVTIPVLGDMNYEDWAKVTPDTARLIETTKAALNIGIKQIKAGSKLGRVSSAIQSTVEKQGFGVIREMVGHGVGRNLHEEPQIPNYGDQTDGPVLEEGMVLAIEPMVSMGDWQLKKNGQVYCTRDGSIAAHFEHTVAVTKDGPEILTLSNSATR
jgi:methionyl aminopeptidase